MNNLLLLAFEYLKVGLFAFGGGMATIPFLFDMSKRHPGWFSSSDIADMLAISEGTPGPVGINMASFCGFRIYGVLGAVIATFSLVFPSFVILYILSNFMYFNKYKIVQNTMFVLKIATVVLFLLAFYNIFYLTFFHQANYNFISTYKITQNTSVNLIEILLFVLCFILSEIKPFKKMPSVFFVFLFGAITCVIF